MVVFIGLKDEQVLEVHAGGVPDQSVRHIRSYPVLAASGHAGPKLREGDLQVPEGLYRVESLHPNSRYHLALRLNYPNEFDRAQAQLDSRANLGGDIMIHGGERSAGCLAVGDRAAEDLFVLAALTGIDRIRVLLSPLDFRTKQTPPPRTDTPLWVASLYETIGEEFKRYPLHLHEKR